MLQKVPDYLDNMGAAMGLGLGALMLTCLHRGPTFLEASQNAFRDGCLH